jgi:hypothetical protein
MWVWSGWSVNARVVLVLVLGAFIALASSYLRFRVYAFTLYTYPDYHTSEWAPFVQAFRELSWFGYALSLILIGSAVNRWLSTSRSAGAACPESWHATSVQDENPERRRAV